MENALLMTVKLDYDKSTWDVLHRERELEQLARSAGAVLLGGEICHLPSPTPKFYIGEGKVQEIAGLVVEKKADLVVFNNNLTGTQHRNLEQALGCRVVDRTQLILDIFARRARSPEGKAQVELAQLEYLLPRLAGAGKQLSRLGGGIGTRGPGEQKLEEDRRRIRDRVGMLKRQLKALDKKRRVSRDKRDELSLPTVVFVGYTSAGKSTLFNALTGSEQRVSDGLFTTLDPLMRAIYLANNQKVLLSDTVGFINQLPHHLVEAFKATLSEVTDADLLIHVLDISAEKAKDYFDSVKDVLSELGAQDTETILVFNKVDLIEDKSFLDRMTREYPEGVFVSALKRENLKLLLRSIQEHLSGYLARVDLLLPLDKMDLVDVIYREGKVEEISYTDENVHVRAILPAITARKLKDYEKKIK